MFRVFISPWFVLAWIIGSVLVVVFQTWVWMRVRGQFNSWHPVSATIVESWVRSYNEMHGEYVREPVIKFSYHYQGREYVSDTPFWRSFTLGPSFIDLSEQAKLFEKGDQVTARLHPAHPEACFIDVAKFDFKSVFVLAGGILLTGAGSFLLGWFIRGDF